MAKIHDKFVIELAEVIKGYGNDPDVDDPFRLSEFYRFYELPEIAVSENHFKTMIPLEVVEKNAQPGWIPCSERLPKNNGQVLVYARSVHYALAKYDEMREADGTYKKQWVTFDAWKPFYTIKDVLMWMPLPEPWEGGQYEQN